jgi:Protein of unknown function (DUF1583)
MNATSFRILLLTASALSGQATSALAQDATKYAHEFYHDFRGKPLPKELHVVGKPDNDFIKEEPEGFRITWPKTRIHAFGGVGCRTSFSIKGDFEITGTFEILQADEPPKGISFGVGASLRVQQADPAPEGATIARVVRAGGKQILVWDRVPDKGGKNAGGVHPCKDNLVRLRLKRTGTTLHYLWAPGLAGDNFQEIHAYKNFGDSDIVAARMNVLTGREPCNVDVRFIDLRVRSGGLVAADAPNVAPVVAPLNNLAPAPDDAPKSRTALIVTLVVGLAVTVLLMLGVAAGIYLKRQHAGAAPEAKPRGGKKAK